MSMLIGFQNDDEVILAADTALTTMVKGEQLRSRKAMQKLIKVGNFLLFGCGQADIFNWVASKFASAAFKSVEQLRDICQECCEEFASKYPNVYHSIGEKTRGIALLAAEFKSGKVITYMINQKDGYEIHSFVQPNDSTRTFTGGIFSDVAGNKVDKMIKAKVPVMDIINAVFHEVSGAEVGGSITIARLNRHGIVFLPEVSIREKVRLRIYEDVCCSHQSYGPLSNAHLVGSTIRSGNAFPRTEMSSSEEVFRAYKDASHYVEITTNFTGSPALNLVEDSATRGQVYSNGGQMTVNASSSLLLQSGGDINLAPGFLGGKVQTSWPQLYSQAAGRSLQDELNMKQATDDAWNTYAVNMAFDPSTRNLKLFNRFGTKIAEVNIPS